MGDEGFLKRDVELIQQSVSTAMKGVSRLSKISHQMELSSAMVALTHASEWLTKLADRVPERMS